MVIGKGLWMKKVIFTLLLLSGMLFAQGGRFSPAFRGFVEILPDSTINSAVVTSAVKTSDAYGMGTFWISCSATNAIGDIEVSLDVYNKKAGTWGQHHNETTVTVSGLTVGNWFVNLDEFGYTWSVGDSVKFTVTPASGDFTAKLYFGVE